MKLLAIETSASACSLALQIDSSITEHHVVAPMQQAKQILPGIKALLQEKEIQLNQLDAIAFGCGPGSFTGVRIAVSVVQGLAFAADLRVIPISSLASTAQAAFHAHAVKKMLVAIDARMNEVYWAKYVVNQSGLVELVGVESVDAPEAITAPDSEWFGVGNAWSEYRSRIAYSPAGCDSLQVPTAAAILPLAEAAFQRGEWVSAVDARPIYLRDKVASKKGE